jgi:hypothetical protein
MIGIDELKPHEEVVEKSVELLANKILSQAVVRDPLLVDQESLVILDGMHRLSSLKTLKCRFAPCCLLDYDSDKIKVGSWYRLFNVEKADKVAEDLLKKNALDYSKQKTTFTKISNNPQAIVMTVDGTTYSVPNADPVKGVRTAVLLEKEMVKTGHRVEYLSEEMAIQQLRSREMTFIIATPIFSKEQIRRCGIRGDLLPHKVTRHVIPSRPLSINVPLSLLRDQEISGLEADLKLKEILSLKRMTLKPPGSVVEGRRYEEELLVFS